MALFEQDLGADAEPESMPQSAEAAGLLVRCVVDASGGCRCTAAVDFSTTMRVLRELSAGTGDVRSLRIGCAANLATAVAHILTGPVVQAREEMLRAVAQVATAGDRALLLHCARTKEGRGQYAQWHRAAAAASAELAAAAESAGRLIKSLGADVLPRCSMHSERAALAKSAMQSLCTLQQALHWSAATSAAAEVGFAAGVALALKKCALRNECCAYDPVDVFRRFACASAAAPFLVDAVVRGGELQDCAWECAAAIIEHGLRDPSTSAANERARVCLALVEAGLPALDEAERLVRALLRAGLRDVPPWTVQPVLAMLTRSWETFSSYIEDSAGRRVLVLELFERLAAEPGTRAELREHATGARILDRLRQPEDCGSAAFADWCRVLFTASTTFLPALMLSRPFVNPFAGADHPRAWLPGAVAEDVIWGCSDRRLGTPDGDRLLVEFGTLILDNPGASARTVQRKEVPVQEVAVLVGALRQRHFEWVSDTCCVWDYVLMFLVSASSASREAFCAYYPVVCDFVAQHPATPALDSSEFIRFPAYASDAERLVLFDPARKAKRLMLVLLCCNRRRRLPRLPPELAHAICTCQEPDVDFGQAHP